LPRLPAGVSFRKLAKAYTRGGGAPAALALPRIIRKAFPVKYPAWLAGLTAAAGVGAAAFYMIRWRSEYPNGCAEGLEGLGCSVGRGTIRAVLAPGIALAVIVNASIADAKAKKGHR